MRTVNTCGEESAARWNLIQALSSYHNTTSGTTGRHLPHVILASRLQGQLVPVLTALQLSYTSLQPHRPASQLTAASRLVSQLGWTQVRYHIWLVSQLGWTQVRYSTSGWSVSWAGHR